MDTPPAEILTEPVSEMTCSACAHPLDVSGLPAFTEIACPECHTPQKVPTRLGTFLLVELLGKGGMGAVYRGHDPSLDRWVAVKVMLASLGANEDFVATFRREAQAAAALNHPNIVQIYSFGVAHGQPYMVMELLEGGRLDQMIAKGEPLNESLVLKICGDVAEGLNAAATIGLIHGDVKPENILLDANGTAKVVDFGLARFRQSKDSGEKGIWGTPYYIAPEKIRGQPNDARSDIYSLGGTLFHALTLKPPFDGETPLDVVKARLSQPAPTVRSLRSDITPEVDAIVARMLEVDPLRRYPTYLSLLSDIRATQAKLKPPPSSTPFTQGTKRGGKIILTRKKGGSASSSGAAISGPITIRAGMTEMANAAPVPALLDEKPPMRRGVKLALIIGGATLGTLLAAGGITWGVIHYRHAKAERLAAEQETARLNRARMAATTICQQMETVVSNAARRASAAQSWATNAYQAVAAIDADRTKLTDASLATESEANARLLTETISQAATGAVSTALLDIEALADAARSNRAVIVAATHADQAEAILATLTNIPAQAAVVEETQAGETAKADQALRDLLTLQQRIADAARTQQAAAEVSARERAEAERRAKEEAERERLAAEKERQLQDELRSVQDLRKANSILIQQNRFKQAETAMNDLAGRLTSEAGKVACKAAIERYRLLDELKTFIIAGVTEEVRANPATGYKFGWLSAKDVLAADDAKVTVRGGSIPWEQVPPAQVIRFARHFAANPDLLRGDAARHYLAAAVYAFEADAGSENARKTAAGLITEALHASATIEAHAKAVLPDVPPSE